MASHLESIVLWCHLGTSSQGKKRREEPKQCMVPAIISRPQKTSYSSYEHGDFETIASFHSNIAIYEVLGRLGFRTGPVSATFPIYVGKFEYSML